MKTSSSIDEKRITKCLYKNEFLHRLSTGKTTILHFFSYFPPIFHVGKEIVLIKRFLLQNLLQICSKMFQIYTQIEGRQPQNSTHIYLAPCDMLW